MPGALHKKNGTMMRKGGVLVGDRSAETERQKRRRVAKEIANAIVAHPCGTCDACCTVKQIGAINKPEGQPCEHLRDTDATGAVGCSIYGKRPQPCKDYFCAWKYGIVGDDSALRPDALGVLFDIAEAPPPGVLMLSVREVYSGAIENHMQELNEIVAERGYVLYLIRGDKRHFMGPEEKVRACHEWSRRHLPLVAR